MFLIEFTENKFIDAERIDFINLADNKVIFQLVGDNESFFTVDKALERQFINKLEDVNQGSAIASRHHHINNPNTKY